MLGCLLFWTCAAAAASAPAPQAAPPHVDEVRVDAATGRLTLLAVADERIVSRAAADRLRRKLNGYARYARSGQAARDRPGAAAALPPVLGVKVAAPLSAVERQNLEGIRLQYRHTDIRFTIEVVEPGASRAATP